jgi:RHS repeat-associated protein
LSYVYNQLSQLTEITRPGNVKVGYTYNLAGEITAVTGQGYAGVTSYASGLVYRAFGSLKQMNYANGRSLSLSYNNRMLLTQWSIPGVLRWNYAYHYFSENTGRAVYGQNLDDGTLDRAWNYDHAGRPTHFTSGSNARHYTGQGGTALNDGPYSQGYGFDVWGNRTYFEGWGGIGGTGRIDSATFTNNKRNGFTYDAAGNLTNDGGQTFTYDATGQQATASYSGYSLQQMYDGDRLRVKKIENGTATYYLRSEALGGQIVAELNSSGATTRGFVYVDGQLLAVQQNNQVSWVHQDPVAKSKRVTDGSGNVISTIELDPWGGDTTRSNNEAFQPRRFTTYDRDGNASDDAMHRRYNRWHSRFDQPDPYGGSYDITNPQSFNRYTYALNDPVNLADPNGLDPGDCADEYNATGGCTITPDDDGGGGGGAGIGGAGDAGMRRVDELPNENEGGGGGGGPQDPQPHPTPTPQQPKENNACVDAAYAKIHNNRYQTDRARTAISNLLAESSRQGLTAAQAAYVLASAEHESNMGNSMIESASYAGKMGYSVTYRGRGYVHLTHVDNYRQFGVARNPASAAQPATAARIAVEGMRNGMFRDGHSLERYVPRNGEPDFYNARWIVNGNTRRERRVARRLAGYADDYLAALKECGFAQ